ncbi:MAG TPA: YihY/virulence factor BrkB family protein [Prochlorococcaceae cyanobacterium Fu_MAG_50]|nr:YihY/virulence factor BrkB family protein [Prochlorococcaceae cyanobacterium Fu_MAG_50]
MKQRSYWIIRRLWMSGDRWAQFDCVDLSAAFAYYTLQSIFPLLLLTLAIASWLLGRQQQILNEILQKATQVLPPSVGEMVDTTLASLVSQNFGAGLLGAFFLMVTAGNAYLTLQRGTERIWEDVLPKKILKSVWSAQVARFLLNRIEAFVVVSFAGIVIVLDEISANIRMIPIEVWDELSRSMPSLAGFIGQFPVLQVGQFIIPFLSLSGMALLMQLLLLRRRLPIRPLMPGSLLIGLSLTCLNLVVGKSIISLGSRFQAYGVIGSVIVLTIWIWMVGVVVYFGQCLNVVLTREVICRRGEPNPCSD